MKKMFNRIADINGNNCKYPVAEDGAVFCFTRDRKYCIYALYTKKDFTAGAVIELDKATYDAEYARYEITYGKSPTTLFLKSIEAVKGVTSFAKYKATVDNTALEDLYNLNNNK